MTLSLRNFYKPARADVQRFCAALKAVGGVVSASTLVTTYAKLAFVGLALAALGEGIEKMSAAPAPAAAPDPKTDPSMSPADVEPENEHA